jgi:NADH-quinone oxidoreductase subunit N
MPGFDFAWIPVAPFIVLSLLGFFVLILGIVFPKMYRGTIGTIVLIGFASAFVITLQGWGDSHTAFFGMITADKFSTAFGCIFILGATLTLGLSLNPVEDKYLLYADYFALVIFATAGMSLMAAGTNLLTLFLGLETLSIALYVLAGFRRSNVFALEASFKYFLLGAFASGFLLYGIALIYGVAGSTDLARIAEYVSREGIAGSKLFFAGFLLLLVGLGFKISVFPFHLWAPDVYQGAPTPISAFMATGSKAAGFAALLRVVIGFNATNQAGWQDIIWIIAVTTMILGNIIALRQDNVKRMLAYSSIAHAGYILIGVLAGNHLGSSGIIFYLLTYTFMNIGAFGVISYLSTAAHEFVTFQDFRGLASRRPFAAIAMATFMFSLAGIPPMAGFIAKFFLFSAGIIAGYLWLVIIAVITSMISLYYYLGLVVQMFMKEQEERPAATAPLQPAVAIALSVAMLAVFVLGILPSRWVELFQDVARSLM